MVQPTSLSSMGKIWDMQYLKKWWFTLYCVYGVVYIIKHLQYCIANYGVRIYRILLKKLAPTILWPTLLLCFFLHCYFFLFHDFLTLLHLTKKTWKPYLRLFSYHVVYIHLVPPLELHYYCHMKKNSDFCNAFSVFRGLFFADKTGL